MKKEVNKRNQLKNETRRAVSPVVSTTILIMIVIIIAIIIILFARSFIKELILKEVAGNSRRVQDFCKDITLKPILNEDGSFGVTNEGNVPVYKIVLKTSNAGSSDTVQIDKPIDPGYSLMIEVPSSNGGFIKRSDYEEVKVIPILLGKRKTDLLEPYTCPDEYGVSI